MSHIRQLAYPMRHAINKSTIRLFSQDSETKLMKNRLNE